MDHHRPAPRVLSTTVGAEAVLMDTESGVYFGLNEVGARIWRLLSEHRSPQVIATILVDEYDVDAAAAEGDVRRLIAELQAKGLLERSATE